MFRPINYENTIRILENRDYVEKNGIILNGFYIPILEITMMNVLTQCLGYVKYMNGSQGQNVFYRGQTGLFDGHMIPSLYRINEYQDNRVQYAKRKQKMIYHSNTAKINAKHFSDMPDEACIPLLQHYGVKTDWIDLVDNIWVALWFALHKATCENINKQQFLTYLPLKDDQYGYIQCLCADAVNEYRPGVFEGSETKVVDLRKAVPSVFLRPHAQHGIMLYKKSNRRDYCDRTVCIIKIKASDGLKWLGNSAILCQGYLFPSAFLDHGYKLMLNEIEPYYKQHGVDTYGTIQVLV